MCIVLRPNLLQAFRSHRFAPRVSSIAGLLVNAGKSSMLFDFSPIDSIHPAPHSALRYPLWVVPDFWKSRSEQWHFIAGPL